MVPLRMIATVNLVVRLTPLEEPTKLDLAIVRQMVANHGERGDGVVKGPTVDIDLHRDKANRAARAPKRVTVSSF
jgi:hypothetical protein